MSITSPIWHYLDPKELYTVIAEHKKDNISIGRLPKDVRNILKEYTDTENN